VDAAAESVSDYLETDEREPDAETAEMFSVAAEERPGDRPEEKPEERPEEKPEEKPEERIEERIDVVTASEPDAEPDAEPDTRPEAEPATRPHPAADAGRGPDAAGLLSEVISAGDGPAQELHVRQSFVGQRITGEGRLTFSTRIYGVDMDLKEESGFKLTVEVPVPEAGVMGPKVLLHLTEDPGAGEAPARFGDAVRFEGEVAGYQAMGKKLLLQRGRLLQQA
jgi:hypothetical protein